MAAFEMWVRACEEWATEHGRLPQISGAVDLDELRLGRFLGRCRHAERGGEGASAFTPERRALLERCVPGWMGAVHREPFEARARACGEWVAAHGRLPSTAANDPAERRVANFLSQCRHAERGGPGASAFTPERRALLDRYAPGWGAPRRGRAV